jgi:hypothetical protein
VPRVGKSYFCPYAVSALVLAVCCLPAFAQRSALVTPGNIADLTQQAAIIVRGQVVSAKIEPHPELTNLTTVVVTMRVSSTLKGSAASIFTFRQFVWDMRDKYDAAGYQKGQQILLLLNPISSYGLTSPAGMEQGRFVITKDEHGKSIATNGYANVGIFSNVETKAVSQKLQLSAAAITLVRMHSRGPVDLDQLENLIRQFAGTSK